QRRAGALARGHRRRGARRRSVRRRGRGREDLGRDPGARRGQPGQRASHRPGAGAAGCGTGEGLQPRVPAQHHLRQGPRPVRGRAAGRGPGVRPDGGRGAARVQAPDLRGQRDHHRRGAGRPGRGGHRAHRVMAGSRARRRRAGRGSGHRRHPARPHPLRRPGPGQVRPPRPAERQAGGVGRSRRGVEGELRHHLQAGRQARRGGGRLARGGRRRLRPERAAGRPDRQDHRPRAVPGGGHLRRDPAPDRHQGRRHDRGDQQGSGRADLRDRRRRPGGRPVHAVAGARGGALRIAEPGPRETAGSHAAPLSLALIGPIWPYRGGIAQYNTSLKRALGPRVARLVAISFKRQYPRWLYPGQSDVERDTDGQRDPDAYYLLDPLSPLSWKRTVDMVAASGCTCVIFHWWTLFWAPVFALIARQLRKRGIRVVFLGHNLADHDAGRTKARLANRLLSSADAYIVHSTEQAAAIGALRPDAPVLHRLHPVYDRFPAPRGLLPKRGRLEVLFFGFIRPYKGLTVLLEAVESMADDGVFLTVVGECWDQADGKAIESSRQRLGTNLEVRLEYVDDAQAAEYFARADVVALPYLDAT